MTSREDSSGGVLSSLPDEIAEVDRGLSGLSRTGPAGSGPFLIEGGRARVVGIQAKSGATFVFPSQDHGAVPSAAAFVLEDAGLGRAANLLLFPGVVRRDFAGASGTAVETIVAAPSLPLVVWQTTTPSPGTIGPIHAEVSLPSNGAQIERSPNGVALLHGDDCIAVGVSPTSATLGVVDIPGGVGLTIDPGDGPTVTISVAAGTRAEVRAALSATRHLPGHVLRAARPPGDGLTLVTGIDELDEGVAWARMRLGQLIANAGHAPLTLGLATLGSRDRDAAAAAIRKASHHCADAEAVLSARYSSVLGNPSAAASVAERWIADVDARPSGDLSSLAASLLADGLQHAATPETIASLRKAAAQPATGGANSLPMVGRTGSLPMVGRAGAAPESSTSPASDQATWLACLLEGEPSDPIPRGHPTAEMVRRTAVRFRQEPDRAWIDWRQVLAEGLAAGPSGPATWDAPAGREEESVTAELILALVHGLLGIEHDAPVGRIRLAPRLPSHLTSFEVRGIGVGEATLRLGYERRSGEESGTTHHRFVLTPEFASVPPLIVFEPAVRGEVRKISIDGAPVDLDIRTTGALSIVPVQLPLDGVRTLDVVTG